jgi:hypothetical protein
VVSLLKILRFLLERGEARPLIGKLLCVVLAESAVFRAALERPDISVEPLPVVVDLSSFFRRSGICGL